MSLSARASPDNTKVGSTANDEDSRIQPQHSNPIPPNTDPKARMLIGFTCTVCNHRAHKTMSKHAYNHGIVIMQCDHCKNRHLIADHLGWFKDGGVTVEDLVKAKGETVQKLTKSFQLVKDGQATLSSSSPSSLPPLSLPPPAAIPEVDTITPATTGASETSTTGSNKPKTELELALEKAAMGTLEWIPKDILQDEEKRMRKSQESLDQSKKQ
ncbi:Threonine synthase-like 1 [Mortierella sp. AD094]|nr:Threonine synthase-like 1 [Mortierella sp. AD094]